MGVVFLAEAQDHCGWAYYLLKIHVCLIQETHTFVDTGVSLPSSLG